MAELEIRNTNGGRREDVGGGDRGNSDGVRECKEYWTDCESSGIRECEWKRVKGFGETYRVRVKVEDNGC